MKSGTELTSKTDAQKLADEIYHVYCEVRAIIPDVHRRIGPADPTWILLKTEKKDATEKQATMRDYVLHHYATAQYTPASTIDQIRQQAIACPLSFDVTSNPAIFDIDHFHSRVDMMDRLEELETDQILLQAVKSELQKKGLPEKVVNKIIPDKEGQYKVTGLKNLYYNYPKNLWPLSGPVNSQKQDQSPLTYAAEMTFSALHTYAHEESFAPFLTHMQEEFQTDPSHMTTLGDSEKEQFLSRCLADGFTDTAQEPYILPYMIDDDGSFVGELDFFKRTILGQTAENYCNARADLMVRSMNITSKCLKNKPEYRPGVKAIFKCMNKAIAGENSSISSGSDLDIPSIKFMSAVRDHVDHTIEKQKRKRESSASSSSLIQHSSPEKVFKPYGVNSPFLFAKQSKNNHSKHTKNIRQKLRQQNAQAKPLSTEQEEAEQHDPKHQKRPRIGKK
ncbi:MAG: hypothetical protein NTZ86_08900 [Legionellales bacterium]|nr:hypothetical protein [Legionellales bacterium]